MRGHINRLLSEVQELELTKTGKRSTMLGDVESGRANVALAQMHLRLAIEARDTGDETEAMRRLILAQFAWASALKAQLPVKRRTRLSKRPDPGGRPTNAVLDVLLFEAAEAETGGVEARCWSAIGKDAQLQERFGELKGPSLRAAYHRGRKQKRQ